MEAICPWKESTETMLQRPRQTHGNDKPMDGVSKDEHQEVDDKRYQDHVVI